MKSENLSRQINVIKKKIGIVEKNNPMLFLNINNSLVQLNKDLNALISFVNEKNISIAKVNSFKDKEKLQIGGGSRILDDYLNLDIFQPADIVWDVRSKMPFPNNRFKEIFCEHFFEHLYYPKSAVFFLKEVYRILKKGGELKIVVPDCGKSLKEYSKRNNKYFKKLTNVCYSKRISTMEINSNIDVINYLFRDQFDNPNYTVHWWGYDQENLLKLLKKAGFSLVKKWKFDKTICNLERKYYSLYLIAKK